MLKVRFENVRHALVQILDGPARQEVLAVFNANAFQALISQIQPARLVPEAVIDTVLMAALKEKRSYAEC